MEGQAAVKVHRHEVVMTGLCKTRFVGLHLGFADSAMGSLHLLTSGVSKQPNTEEFTQ